MVEKRSKVYRQWKKEKQAKLDKKHEERMKKDDLYPIFEHFTQVSKYIEDHKDESQLTTSSDEYDQPEESEEPSTPLEQNPGPERPWIHPIERKEFLNENIRSLKNKYSDNLPEEEWP